MNCPFCSIIEKSVNATIVFENETSLAFLDHRPLFPGHCLLVPKEHYETLADLPADVVGPFFLDVQMLSRAVEIALEAQGSFVAMNNRVSQSVPHLHVHIVPRSKGDGLKGFFWPRTKYKTDTHLSDVQSLIQDAIRKIQHNP